jgi:CRP-like cAMP-binding protein
MKVIQKADFLNQISIDALGAGSIFGALSADSVEYLLEHGELIETQADEQLFTAGDSGEYFFIVCRGKLEFYRCDLGKHLRTRTAEFGEELGFAAMIALHKRTGEAITPAPSLLLKIDTSLFGQFHEAFPFDFGIMTLNLARGMARSLRQLNNEYVEHA